MLERERIIRLSRRDSEVFFKALEKPPAPNTRLKKAVAAYKRSPLHAEMERLSRRHHREGFDWAGPELFMPLATLRRALNQP